MTKLAFLSMDSLAGFVSYDALVQECLEQAGCQVDEVSWRRPDVDWDQYDLVVIRSPWDYQQDAERFLQTLAGIERSRATLLNSLSVVKWNIRKTYLRTLEEHGITIVPTHWLQSPEPTELRKCLEETPQAQFVIKPVVGANADNAFRLDNDTPQSELIEISRVYAGTLALMQPFVESVVSYGEESLILFDGKFSHAVLKTPRVGDFRVQEEHGGHIRAIQPSQDLIAVAEQCVRWLSEPLLYARVDLVRLGDGRPAVMELELIEPSLYLSFDSMAPGRFAEAILRRLRK